LTAPALGSAVLLALASQAAGPPRLAPEPAVALEQVVNSALRNNPDLQLAALSVQSTRGTLLAAAAPFDSTLALVAGAGRSHQLSSPSEPMASTLVLRDVTLRLGWSRLFRSGVLVAPELSSNHTLVQGDPALEYRQSSARLRVSVPLLRDFGGIVSAAPERAAEVNHRASQLDQSHSGAQVVFQAASAYWGYLAASRRVEVFVSSESRADRTAADIAALVKADERTRADLNQARGVLASRRADRMAAEQDRIAAWALLAVITGAVPEDASTLPAPVSDFPAGAGGPAAETLLRWQARGLAERTDLAAARARLEETAVRVRAARNELWPRLDLQGSGGLSGEQRGAGLNQLVNPRQLEVPGADLAVQLTFLLPVERHGLRGRLIEESAAQARAQLGYRELERRIRIGVAAALEYVRRSQMALRESEEAVTLLQQTVEGEKHKFRLGLSTLFAVLQAEDALNSALLAKIEGQRAFAVALASLRFETGTLLPPGSSQNLPDLTSRLTVLP
jgi:outer membrane protein